MSTGTVPRITLLGWGITPSSEKLQRLARRRGYEGIVRWHPANGYVYSTGPREHINLGNSLPNARRAIAQWPKR